MIGAVVLAAGASTRYGRPKQRELLPAVLERLSRAPVDELVVVEGAHTLDPGPSVSVVRADDWERGPGASLRAGLAALSDETTHAVVVLADEPGDEADVLAASYDGTRDHPVLLARAAWNKIPDEGGRALEPTLVDCSDLEPPGDVDFPPTPTLVVVSGPPGSGKTSLAHALAQAIPCPAVCRDEIKEGMVHAHGGEFTAAPGDPLTQRTLPLFFEVLRMLLAAGVTVVAEAAFQDPLWRSGLEPLSELAELRIVQCHVDPALAHERAANRSRQAHADATLFAFDRVSLDTPTIDVDTTDGYAPGIAEIVAFVNRR